MPLGKLGTFDDGGIMPCCVVPTDNGLYLYYNRYEPYFTASPYVIKEGCARSQRAGHGDQGGWLVQMWFAYGGMDDVET